MNNKISHLKNRSRTTQIRGGLHRSSFQETAEALYLTSGYVYESAEEAEAAFNGEKKRYVYGRFANPTTSIFEERLAQLEGALRCLGTASGMAAVNAALMASCKAGGRVVASRALFGSCFYLVKELLPRFGVSTLFVDGTDLNEWQKALCIPADVVFLETPSNPTLELVDLAAVSQLAHQAKARVIVDNVFATPLYQKPLELGADVVVYSATKHIDGQGRTMGGAILSNDESWVDEELLPFLRNTGPTLSPFNAWVLAKGLETLELRVTRQTETAMKIACFLEQQTQVLEVRYPGLASHPQYHLAQKQMNGSGTLLSFSLRDRASAFRFLNALELIDISNNLGDSKSLITHPATTTHQKLTEQEREHLGIGQGTLRLSVGLEDAEDLIEDLNGALLAAPTL